MSVVPSEVAFRYCAIVSPKLIWVDEKVVASVNRCTMMFGPPL